MRILARLLFFRLGPDEYRELGARAAALGVLCAWIAGIGRYWDHPTAGLAQKSGLGSVVYVFALAALLWLRLARRDGTAGELSFPQSPETPTESPALAWGFRSARSRRREPWPSDACLPLP